MPHYLPQAGSVGRLSEIPKDRSFELAVERAASVASLHRVFVSGSDRDSSSWLEDYDIAGVQGLTVVGTFGLTWTYRQCVDLPLLTDVSYPFLRCSHRMI